MFRIVLFSIVVSLAVGQNATLSCRAWCDLRAAAASGCRYEESTGSACVAADKNCDDELSVGAFVREEGARAVTAPDMAHAMSVPRYQLSQSTTNARPDLESGSGWALGKRHLSLPLRI